MRKSMITGVAALGLVLAGPALADCEGELMQADADIDAAVVAETERAEAAAMLAEAEAALAAGDEMACLDLVAQARSTAGVESLEPDTTGDAPNGEADPAAADDADDGTNGADQ